MLNFGCSVRRSGAIAETFTWDVDFATPFEKVGATFCAVNEIPSADKYSVYRLKLYVPG